MGVSPVIPQVGYFFGAPKNLRIEFIRNALPQLNTFPYLKMSFTGTFKAVKAQVTKCISKFFHFPGVKGRHFTFAGIEGIW